MCDHGDTVDQWVIVPAHLAHSGTDSWKLAKIDRCIAPLVAALNAGGIATSGSCCGHGKGFGSVLLRDGRELVVLNQPRHDSASAARPGPSGECLVVDAEIDWSDAIAHCEACPGGCGSKCPVPTDVWNNHVEAVAVERAKRP